MMTTITTKGTTPWMEAAQGTDRKGDGTEACLQEIDGPLVRFKKECA
ncbi:MAG: hypothetical protein KF693_16405 [Nitrospira sp.]|nr:hypothetical protein [Nitrospira sp.]